MQIIALVDIQPPASKSDFNDVYEITELMDTDLHQIIRSNQPLTDEHFRYFMYQVGAPAPSSGSRKSIWWRNAQRVSTAGRGLSVSAVDLLCSEVHPLG